ncbi:DUF3108 domain-containing protein [Sphaerotilus mobilis]|uniref:DUF3108 domain-containing protein n=1 Tax=Sphaerotilus mobilis TaxID=47994 RepID=A0A4Q7LEZ0_9BURK|nr:DUF3108 domain-containing protein [Sphaerotilus mobilis]RZS52147.1 hypothetical protein EV685_3337 [Sphaerotilus mobilis]
MSSKIPVSPSNLALRRPRRAPWLCLLAVLGLHGLALREAPSWLARPAQAASEVPASPRSVSTRTMSVPTEHVAPAAPAPIATVADVTPTRAVAPARRPAAPTPSIHHVVALNDAAASAATSAAPAPEQASVPADPSSHRPPVTAPAPIRLDYKLQRGAIGGEARLDWRHDGRRYTLDLDGQLPLIGTLMHQHSEGGFDAAGLAPLRYTERRLRRSERAVNFNRPADGQGGRITFSATTGEAPLRSGAQDRVSWMVQLAARLAGHSALPAVGSRIEMDVASAGGDVQDWHFVLQGRATDGSWHWRRDTGEPDATQAEVWTDPTAGHWPRRVRLTERQGEPIELVLRKR